MPVSVASGTHCTILLQ